MDNPHSYLSRYHILLATPSQLVGLPKIPFLRAPLTKSPAPAQTALFSKWKTISGVLLQRYKQKPLTDNDARISSIRQALTTLDPILQTFTNPSTDQNARQRNLEAILSRVAQFAFLIFTQPGSFAFDFKGTGTGESGGIVVFPALVQTVSDEAEVLARPRVLSEREVVMGFGA